MSRRGRVRTYLPRVKAIRDAVKAVKLADAEGQLDAHVLFGYVCERCKTDCFFVERNYAPRTGVCFTCGHEQRVEKLMYKIMVYKDEKEAYGLVRKDRQSLSGSNNGGTDSGDTGKTRPDREG